MGPSPSDLQELLALALAKIGQLTDLRDLDDLRVHYLGKKGLLTELLKQVGQASPEERPRLGQWINVAKEQLLQALQHKKSELDNLAISQRLASESLDISLPGRCQTHGSLHPITHSFDRIKAFFKARGFDIADGPEIENEFYNFEALNIPKHHPARASQDTFYFPDGQLLRTHTSPVQIRHLMETQPPIRMIAPGRVYRCDFDVTHTPMFHQVEGLVIDEKTSFADLKSMLQQFLNDFFESDLPIRLRPSYFPFTEPSAEVDIQCVNCHGKGCRICKQSGWLEVLGCGMVHPKVLAHVNIDADHFQGYAFGLGVDRLTMLRYQIDDLRMMFENDQRFLEQF